MRARQRRGLDGLLRRMFALEFQGKKQRDPEAHNQRGQAKLLFIDALRPGWLGLHNQRRWC
jgi:hypothetical protein